jgi:ATP:corrinoid adenosyltransferase
LLCILLRVEAFQLLLLDEIEVPLREMGLLPVNRMSAYVQLRPRETILGESGKNFIETGK